MMAATGLPVEMHPLAFLAALLAAAAMGFAIQQGGTCMVGAIGQLVVDRRAGRAIALAECSLWVMALGMLSLAAGFTFRASPGFPLGWTVIGGGLLLGLGALINGACVFGSVARIGNRDFSYLATPPGYFLGSLAHARLWGLPPASAPMGSLDHRLVMALIVLFAISLAVSGRQLLAALRGQSVLRSAWDYRHATIAIGIAFVVLALLAGPWTYTEALGKAAHGRGLPQAGQILLVGALLGGAILGGRGAAETVPVHPRRIAACALGGALMGLGASLIPGGNDNLILAGLPWLQPHAWAAIAAMALAIAAGLLGRGLWRKKTATGIKSRAVRN